MNRRHTDFQSVALPTELPAHHLDLASFHETRAAFSIRCFAMASAACKLPPGINASTRPRAHPLADLRAATWYAFYQAVGYSVSSIPTSMLRILSTFRPFRAKRTFLWALRRRYSGSPSRLRLISGENPIRNCKGSRRTKSGQHIHRPRPVKNPL